MYRIMRYIFSLKIDSYQIFTYICIDEILTQRFLRASVFANGTGGSLAPNCNGVLRRVECEKKQTGRITGWAITRNIRSSTKTGPTDAAFRVDPLAVM